MQMGIQDLHKSCSQGIFISNRHLPIREEFKNLSYIWCKNIQVVSRSDRGFFNMPPSPGMLKEGILSDLSASAVIGF